MTLDWVVQSNCITLFTGVILFSVWLPNRLISAGLKPVLRHTEKLCMHRIVDHFLQIFLKNHKINARFVRPFVTSGLTKLVLNIISTFLTAGSFL